MNNHRPLAYLLLALIIVTVASSGPLVADDEPAMLARFAVLLGDHASDSPPDPQSHAESPADELLTWDYQRDNDELERLFGLESIHTLQLGSARLPAAGGRFSASATYGESDLTVRVRAEQQANLPGAATDNAGAADAKPVVIFRVEVWRDDELLSAPTVANHFGERAIVTSTLSDAPTLLWIVLQADFLPLDP